MTSIWSPTYNIDSILGQLKTWKFTILIFFWILNKIYLTSETKCKKKNALEIKTVNLNYKIFSTVMYTTDKKKINFGTAGDLEIVTRRHIFEYTKKKMCHWGSTL